MTLAGILVTAVVAVVGTILTYFGAKQVQRATARKVDAEAEKTAVDGFDLLTGRLEARLSATEKRLTEVEAERDDYRTRLAHAEREAEEAKAEAAMCRREVDRLTRQVAALTQQHDTDTP